MFPFYSKLKCSGRETHALSAVTRKLFIYMNHIYSSYSLSLHIERVGECRLAGTSLDPYQ